MVYSFHQEMINTGIEHLHCFEDAWDRDELAYQDSAHTVDSFVRDSFTTSTLRLMRRNLQGFWSTFRASKSNSSFRRFRGQDE